VHYYKRNLGDYAKKAGRLSILQHGVYNLLIDACYDREIFPNLDEAIDWVWASTTEEQEAVKFVLSKFFIEENGVFIQKRIQEELADYQAKSENNKRIAQERETKRKRNVNETCEKDNEPSPNHKPITNNHKPITNKPLKTIDNKFSQEDFQFAEYVYQKILGPAPKTKKPDFTIWADSVRLMREVDNHTPQEIMQVFTFANNDPFWQTNILSIPKLRTKFSALHSKMIGEKNNANGSQFSYSRKISRSDRADQEARDYIQKHGLS
tara:strand:+ start:5802 stop:6599 length:798 start_codon:yes stop_codon:yes gene_type:complete